MIPDTDVPLGSEALIEQHMALVGHIVRETVSRVPSHVDRDDLTSAGLAALVQAARAFDPSRGVTFDRAWAYAGAVAIGGGLEILVGTPPPPPASAARSSTSCAASTGPPGRSAGAPVSSTRPAPGSRRPSVGPRPTQRSPRPPG